MAVETTQALLEATRAHKEHMLLLKEINSDDTYHSTKVEWANFGGFDSQVRQVFSDRSGNVQSTSIAYPP